MGEKNKVQGSGFIRNVCIGLISIFILLALLPSTKNFKNWKQSSHEVGNRLSRSPFFISHVFDPSVDGLRFTSWKASDWTRWLQQRDLAHKRASPNRKRTLLEKGLNSIIIASPHQFQNGFQSFHKQDRTGDQYLWSNVRFPSFVFQKNNKGIFHLYQCPPMFFRVKFHNGSPVHLDGHSSHKDQDKWNNFGKVNPSKDCEPVQ